MGIEGDNPTERGPQKAQEEFPKEGGCGSATTRFLTWLKVNGATFDKVLWPAIDAGTGSRGAVALDDIATGEPMIVVPECLMMTPKQAVAHPVIGHVFRENETLLKNDHALALYLMYEKLQGEKSFYAPFLAILPVPRNATHWTDLQLGQLQDERLVQRCRARKRQLSAMYERTIGRLVALYPDIFSREVYTPELFNFAWTVIQTRAFGRRLPWSALVPFADCLNHGNVQTKYDFNVDGSGVFRLFPSGSNSYPLGCEVLNSYGRRPNDNLLVEYGFAMLDNEWDEVEVQVSLDRESPLYDERRMLLHAHSSYTSRTLRIRRGKFPRKLLEFCRVATLPRERVQTELRDRQELARKEEEQRALPAKEKVEATGATGDKSAGPSLLQLLSTLRLETTAAPQRRLQPALPYSAACEQRALEYAKEVLQRRLDGFPTTLEQDLHRREELLESQGGTDREESALCYRITSKRVLLSNIALLGKALRYTAELLGEADAAQPEEEEEHIFGTDEGGALLAYLVQLEDADR